MNKEQKFINIIKNAIPKNLIGDDCAYLKDYNLAFSQDTLIEDVHFKLDFMTPYEIAKKALIVNISDIIGYGAIPKYYSVSLSGKLDEKFVEEFYKGLNEIGKEYDLMLLGGDLTYSEKITISICIIGDCKNRNISSLKNAKNGYVIAAKGNFGYSKKGLEELFSGIKKSKYIEIHKCPILEYDTALTISSTCKYPYAMCDSSDGLYMSLYKIAKESNVKLNIMSSKILNDELDKDYILYGEEDYSLVICLNEDDFHNIPALKLIGYVEEGSGVYLDNQKLKFQSFEHFS